VGDRANIVIREESSWSKPPIGTHEAVFLYSHWSGYVLPEILREALDEGRDGWDDASYLARICFDRMIGTNQGGTIGYGIYTRLTDNEHDLLVLLPSEQRLVVLPESTYRARGFALEDLPSISFEQYIAADERTWDNLTDSAVVNS
jgi:hypothetical protein